MRRVADTDQSHHRVEKSWQLMHELAPAVLCAVPDVKKQCQYQHHGQAHRGHHARTEPGKHHQGDDQDEQPQQGARTEHAQLPGR